MKWPSGFLTCFEMDHFEDLLSVILPLPEALPNSNTSCDGGSVMLTSSFFK